jgi:septal ring factor EnvC (AmiA/AmiB activator)
MSEINVMDFVEAMNAKNAEVKQSNEERVRLLDELERAQRDNSALTAEIERLSEQLDTANGAIYRYDADLQAANKQLREANISKENLRELLAGF